MPHGAKGTMTILPIKLESNNDIPIGCVVVCLYVCVLGVRGNGNITHGVGSLWHWQLPELRAFMFILMMTDIQRGEEVGEKPQDVDNGQFVGRIRLWRESNQALDL